MSRHPVGATVVEYALLVGGIAFVIIVAVAGFGDSMNSLLRDSVDALSAVMH